MRFWIENKRQLNWLKNFAEKNNFTMDAMEEQCLPFSVEFVAKAQKFCRNDPAWKKDACILVKDFIKALTNDKVAFCDGNVIVGPFEKYNDFIVGDKVRFVNPGQLYSTYARWFIEKNIELDIASRYCYMNDGEEFKGKVGTIVACGPHSKTNSEQLYAIEFQSWIDKPVFLVNKDAITLEEME